MSVPLQSGHFLRLARVYHNLNQTQMAKELLISTSWLCEIEAGKKQHTLQLLEKYAGVFQIPVSSLLYFIEQAQLKDGSKLVVQKITTMLDWITTLVDEDARMAE